jgi:1-acyl-sn-glycerol-3-phosphate acyltransferase
MKKDVNGIPVILKEIFILTPFQHILGTFFLKILNRLHVEGRDILKNLPDSNVLFVLNHQTYFMEGIAMMVEFDYARNSILHWCWKAKSGHCYYIVALETAQMKGVLHRIIEWGGAVTISRTWKKGQENLDETAILLDQIQQDQQKIINAINDGWVITFPQGTTIPFSKGRKGTARIIKNTKCIVVPVVVDGFSESFHKSKPCKPLKLGSRLSIRIKPPLTINYDDSEDKILEQIMDAIEQSPGFQPQDTACSSRS